MAGAEFLDADGRPRRGRVTRRCTGAACRDCQRRSSAAANSGLTVPAPDRRAAMSAGMPLGSSTALPPVEPVSGDNVDSSRTHASPLRAIPANAIGPKTVGFASDVGPRRSMPRIASSEPTTSATAAHRHRTPRRGAMIPNQA